MNKPITPEELKAKLKQPKLVEVKGDHYLIHKVSLFLLFDQPEDLWEAARSKEATALHEKISDAVKNPTHDAMKRVLLAGLEEPKLSLVEVPGFFSVEDLLAHYEIAFPLFGSIVSYSMEDKSMPHLGEAHARV
jgi:hypothetical protein